MYHLECKYLLKKGEDFIISDGRARLLELVEDTGSISESARELDMSYRHAWGIIKKIEETVGEKLVETHRGGKNKGGAALTEDGKDLLECYHELKDKHEGKVYRNPALTVDGVLVEDDKVLLIKRKNEPFKGRYALPGGFVEYGEVVEDAVVREFKEETGLDCVIRRLLGVYSDPDRDPRGHTVSIVFELEKTGGRLKADSDAEEVEFLQLDSLPAMAFDHDEIIEDHLLSTGDQPVSNIRTLK